MPFVIREYGGPAILVNHARRLQDPIAAKRWAARWLVGTVIMLALWLYTAGAGRALFGDDLSAKKKTSISICVFPPCPPATMPTDRRPLEGLFEPVKWLSARMHIDKTSGIMALLSGVIYFAFFFGWLVLAVCTNGVRRMYRQRHDDLLAEALFAQVSAGDEAVEPFILYLRPFGSTGTIMTMGRVGKYGRAYELEEALSSAAKGLGRFIALGESVEHPGAGRITLTEVDWQAAARRLMRKALLILLVPSSRPGTLWEMEQLLAQNWIGKTVFIDVPNTSVIRTPFVQHAEWGEISRLFSSHGYQWPADDPQGRLICFGTSQSPQLNEPLEFQSIPLLSSKLKRALTLQGARAHSCVRNAL